MTRLLVAAAALMMLAIPAHADDTAFKPVVKPALFSEVYVPGGFDDNDVVQIVGEGMFRNSCYRPGPANAKVDQKNFTVTLDATAYEYPGICLQVILPFERTIDLGIIRDGNYKVMQNGQEIATFTVAKARSASPDEYLYAPISQAFFRQEGTASKIALTGEFTSDCMKLDRVLTHIEPKVLVVQPVAMMETGRECHNGKFPFSTVVTINNVPKGRYLIHVRSMNAKAVNTLVDVNY